MIYVTFQYKKARYAIECKSVMQAEQTADELMMANGVTWVRMNHCGNVQHRRILKPDDFKEYL